MAQPSRVMPWPNRVRYLGCPQLQTTEIPEGFVPAFSIDGHSFWWCSAVSIGVGVRFDADWVVAEAYWDRESPDHEAQFCGEVGEAGKAKGWGVRDGNWLVEHS